ncbi:MAG: PKD domain-containing protein [bacterium]
MIKTKKLWLFIIISISIILFNYNVEAQVDPDFTITIIDAQVNIDPDTLNLSLKGIWITAYISLPEEYRVEDINVESIKLDNTIAPEMSDIQDNILMVKFNRQEVIDLIKLKGIFDIDPLEVKLKVNGYLNDGVTFFEGTDIISFLWSYVCVTIPYPLHGTTINELQPEFMATYFPGKFEIALDSFYSMLNEVDISNLYSVYADKATFQVDTDLSIGQNSLKATISDVKGNTDIAQSIFDVLSTNNPSIYYFSILKQKGIFTSPGDSTYSRCNISSGLNISQFYVQSFHSALDGSGFYFSLSYEDGIYYTPGDGNFGLFLSSSDLGVQGQYIDAIYTGFDNMVYFSTVGIGDILQSSGDGTNTLYMTADALGISGKDLNSLYIATGKIYFSVTEDGRILESSGDGTNTIFYNPSNLGVPGYKINAFSVIPDDTPPDIQIDQPSDGSTANSSRPNIVASFEDKDIGINTSGLDLTTFTAFINGEDYSSHFTVTQTGASYQSTSDLPEGENTVTVGISDMAGNSGSATSNFTVAIVRAIPGATPTSGPAPLTVHLTTSGEDPSGTIEVYRWDFDGNGSWDTYDTVALDYNHTYYLSGTYNATLYVRSNSGITATASITIAVLNNPPTATADVLPSNGGVPLTVNCHGSGSDPDGTIILYEWDFDGNGTYDWSSSITGNTTHTYTEVGEYHAVFRVTDNFNQTNTAIANTTVVRVGPSGSPTASASANPTTGNAPLTLNFFGTATDPDNNIVLYEWDFEGDGVYDWYSSNNGNTSHIYNAAGIYSASFRVTDSTGLTGIDQILITVGFNSDPMGGKTASASSQHSSSYAPSKAIDNNTNTYWQCSQNSTPCYTNNTFFEVTFNNLVKITGLTINAYSGYRISRGRIEIYNENGDNIFSQEADFPNTISSVSIPPVENAKRLKLVILQVQNCSWIGIREFQVEGSLMSGS